MAIKVYQPAIIEEVPFPQEGIVEFTAEKTARGGNYEPRAIKEASFPTKRVAVELLGAAINTRSKKILAEFQFTEMGALQIGKYVNGVSGDLRISPSGIVGRNKSGVTTFAIDGDTGDAFFAGTIQGGTVIGGKVAVGDGDILIDGETKRMVFYDDSGVPQIVIGKA